MATSLAMSAIGTGVAFQQQSKAADAQAEAIEQERKLQQNDLARQQDQQTAAAADEMNEQARQALADTALFDVITGEYGGGNTANRGMAVMGVQQGEQMATIGSNAKLAASETGFRSYAVNSRSASQAANISRPSAFGTLLTIGAQATSTYASHRQQQARLDQTTKPKP